MDTIRAAIRRLPPGAVIRILRKVFAYPAPAARLFINDITRPRKFHKPWIRKVPWNGNWAGAWIGQNVSGLDDAALKARIDSAHLILFNVHGGGFRLGKPTMYMRTYVRWIKYCKKKHNLDVMIMSVKYRLAPEHKYPSAVEDVMIAYEHLIKDLGVDPAKIVMTGDSSGASLMVEMLFITHDPSMFEIVTDVNQPGDSNLISELPRPAGAVFISPLLTDETNSNSWKTNVKFDYVSQHTAKVIMREYYEHAKRSTDDAASQHHRTLGIAKLQTGFRAFLPRVVLVYVGNKEVLRDDALEFAERARNDGVSVTTVMEDCVHDWVCVREVVKDRTILDRADEKFADFCKDALERAQSQRVVKETSLRREIEGLTCVPEDDEVLDSSGDEFHDVALTETELEAAVLKAMDGRVPPSSTKSSTSTINVKI